MDQEQGDRTQEEPGRPSGDAGSDAGPDGRALAETGEAAPVERASRRKRAEEAPEPAAIAAGEAAAEAAGATVEPAEPERAVAGAAPEPEARPGGRVVADHVNVEQGAIGTAEGLSVDVMQGAIGIARGEHVRLTQGAIGAAIADDVHIQMSGAQLVLARESVHIQQGGAATVIAQHAELKSGSFVGFLVALNAEGETRALFDWRGAIAFGAAFAVVSAILRGRRARR